MISSLSVLHHVRTLRKRALNTQQICQNLDLGLQQSPEL